jgi:hypothetical protein
MTDSTILNQLIGLGIGLGIVVIVGLLWLRVVGHKE